MSKGNRTPMPPTGAEMTAWEEWTTAAVLAGRDMRQAIADEDGDALAEAIDKWDHAIVRKPKRAPRPAFKVRPLGAQDESNEPVDKPDVAELGDDESVD